MTCEALRDDDDDGTSHFWLFLAESRSRDESRGGAISGLGSSTGCIRYMEHRKGELGVAGNFAGS